MEPLAISVRDYLSSDCLEFFSSFQESCQNYPRYCSLKIRLIVPRLQAVSLLLEEVQI